GWPWSRTGTPRYVLPWPKERLCWRRGRARTPKPWRRSRSPTRATRCGWPFGPTTSLTDSRRWRRTPPTSTSRNRPNPLCSPRCPNKRGTSRRSATWCSRCGCPEQVFLCPARSSTKLSTGYPQGRLEPVDNPGCSASETTRIDPVLPSYFRLDVRERHQHRFWVQPVENFGNQPVLRAPPGSFTGVPYGPASATFLLVGDSILVGEGAGLTTAHRGLQVQHRLVSAPITCTVTGRAVGTFRAVLAQLRELFVEFLPHPVHVLPQHQISAPGRGFLPLGGTLGVLGALLFRHLLHPGPELTDAFGDCLSVGTHERP